jgi:hypothetical protein
MGDELRRIEQRLAGRLSSEQRMQLEYEAQQLRQQIRATQSAREDDQESLATTPMVFNYGSGNLVPGPQGRPSLSRELDRAADNFVDGLIMLTVILVTLAPWILLAGLVWWAVRIVGRRLRKQPPAEGDRVS